MGNSKIEYHIHHEIKKLAQEAKNTEVFCVSCSFLRENLGNSEPICSYKVGSDKKSVLRRERDEGLVENNALRSEIR